MQECEPDLVLDNDRSRINDCQPAHTCSCKCFSCWVPSLHPSTEQGAGRAMVLKNLTSMAFGCGPAALPEDKGKGHSD